MSIKRQLDDDIKAAMLSGDKERALTLRGLKSSILYVEVSSGTRDTGLADDKVIDLLSKEAKKRQEAADLYVKGGNAERADAELKEKAIIETYLPAKISEEELRSCMQGIYAELSAGGSSVQMGQLIGATKVKIGAAAEGSLIAEVAKELTA